MAASKEPDDLEDVIQEEARKIAERDLRRFQRAVRKALKELHDPEEE